ncbi:MAG: hypothetical protein KAU14_06465 [Thermoplasmata archaeon]|nr:hypothetical protein [Thermoplasmata archaeon]
MTNTGPYVQYPQQQMPYQSQPVVPQSSGGTGKLYLGLLLTGLILFFVAGIIRSLLLYEDLIEDNQQNIWATTNLLMNIGILIAGTGLSLGAFSASDLDDRVRSTMLIAAGSCFVAGAIINIFPFFD